MDTHATSLPLSRGRFLTTVGLFFFSAVSVLPGCGGGGGGSGAPTRDQLVGRWDSVSMTAEGKVTPCPGSLSLSGGSAACGGYMKLNSNDTYTSYIVDADDDGTWTLSGTTLTLRSNRSTPDRVLTISSVSDLSLVIVSDGITVSHVKTARSTSLPKD